MNSSGLLA